MVVDNLATFFSVGAMQGCTNMMCFTIWLRSLYGDTLRIIGLFYDNPVDLPHQRPMMEL